MSGNLTQEEINKLMDDNKDKDLVDEKKPTLTDFEKDGLGEIGNISMGTASTTLNILLNQEVSITTPEVEVVSWEEAVTPRDSNFIIIEVNYTEGFQGSSILLIKEKDAKIIADLMMGSDGTNIEGDLNDFHISAISEAMNQMIGTSATSMSQIFDITVDIAPPNVVMSKPKEYNYQELFQNSNDSNYFVKTSFRMIVGDLIDSDIMQLLGLPFALDMFNTLINETKNEIENAQDSQPIKVEENNETEYLEETIQDKNTPLKDTKKDSKEDTSDKSEEEKTKILSHIQNKNIDLLMNVPMDVSVELGRTDKKIKDVLNLGPGSIVELDSFSGEKVDILVNGKKIAKGEVVIVDESYGVRVTDILNPKNRL